MSFITDNFDLSFFYRKKKFTEESVQDTKLSRVLGLFDLTALGSKNQIFSTFQKYY